MELKDVILSTLAEMDTTSADRSEKADAAENVSSRREEKQAAQPVRGRSIDTLEDETLYLESVKERLLVLFEGFQAPNNKKLEAKLDLTLNFLEYLLATIDARIDKLKSHGRL